VPNHDEVCRRQAARRVDAGVVDGDGDEVDERQREADGERGQCRRSALVGGAVDDEQEEEHKTISATMTAASEYPPGEWAP
jgi:hypothetical protein